MENAKLKMCCFCKLLQLHTAIILFSSFPPAIVLNFTSHYIFLSSLDIKGKRREFLVEGSFQFESESNYLGNTKIVFFLCVGTFKN